MTSMKELLHHAQAKKYAVGAFNITSLTYLRAILDAAQEKHSPVIISVSEQHIHKGYIQPEHVSRYLSSFAYSIPVVLHLDHGESFSMIQRAVDCGFMSVMIDRSHESLQKNIQDTLAVVKFCSPKGVSVEGELGMIGGKEGDGVINTADPSLFTDSNTALRYASETGVDSLAVAIGNVHGKYSGTPNLDFQRLKEIRDNISIPLVLHGGSGISNEQFQRLIDYGIHKINFYSGNVQSGYYACRQLMDSDPLSKGTDIGELFQRIYRAVKQTTAQHMDIFRSSAKA